MFIVEKKPKSVVTEAYRTLRTNVQYSAFDKEIKTILITSSEVKEGKSTICGNIALSFSKNERKVILIDCDLRKPTLHKMFNVSNVKGLSEVLIGAEELNETIKKYNNNLDILTSGTIPPNPSEMLGSKAMSELLEVLKNKYDTIILDSAPIRVVTDAQILATKVDGTILVVKRDTTKIEAVKDSKNLLNKVGANIIGSILNGMDRPSRKDHSYYSNEEIAVRA